MKISLIVTPLAALVIGCEQSLIESNPTVAPTVTRANAEARYAKYCMKTDTISDSLLREFNAMSVDRIDGFANGCESQERNKKQT